MLLVGVFATACVRWPCPWISTADTWFSPTNCRLPKPFQTRTSHCDCAASAGGVGSSLLNLCLTPLVSGPLYVTVMRGLALEKKSTFMACLPLVRLTIPHFSRRECNPPLSTTIFESIHRRDPSLEFVQNVYDPSICKSTAPYISMAMYALGVPGTIDLKSLRLMKSMTGGVAVPTNFNTLTSGIVSSLEFALNTRSVHCDGPGAGGATSLMLGTGTLMLAVSGPLYETTSYPWDRAQ
mmetsp:Transcript_45427/g.92829  ORF Transcript_45427/g.92829 Transcript_45427/m.92829 type:complete len:238 (+) Transcript_45427:372-1085(+)